MLKSSDLVLLKDSDDAMRDAGQQLTTAAREYVQAFEQLSDARDQLQEKTIAVYEEIEELLVCIGDDAAIKEITRIREIIAALSKY